MSTPYGYDDYSDQTGTGERQESGGMKELREHLKEVSTQLKEMKAENDRLQAAQRQRSVAEALTAQGYSPAAATLYTGEPDQLNGWLAANGSALARLPQAPAEGVQEEQSQTPAGPPQSTVPAEIQAQLRTAMEAGVNGAAPSTGSDSELAARISAAKTPEEFAQLMQANGSGFPWG